MNVEIDLSQMRRLTNSLPKLEDKIVKAIARTTLDYTHSQNAFAYRTGELERSSMAFGVKGSNMEYALGSGVNYGRYVYAMSKGTNWTNPSTRNQWYMTIFKNNKERIIANAINTSIRSV